MSTRAKIALGIPALLLLLVIGGFVFFNAWIYPPLGIESCSRQDYAQAWDRVARGFCDSSGLRYEGVDFLKFREVAGGPAYAWGTARCATPQGGQRLAWIYLEWSTKRKMWMRGYTLVLADDDDEVYYTPTFPKQAGRAATALSKLYRENARHVREYLGQAPR